MAKINMRSVLLKTVRGTVDEVEGILTDIATDGAEKFKEILVEEMEKSNVPQSVIETAAKCLYIDEPDLKEFLSHKSGWYKKGRVEISLNFDGDLTGDRESFYSGGPTGELESIIDIFNNGYRLTKTEHPKVPFGVWLGERVPAKRFQKALKFMQSAKRTAERQIDGIARVEVHGE